MSTRKDGKMLTLDLRKQPTEDSLDLIRAALRMEWIRYSRGLP